MDFEACLLIPTHSSVDKSYIEAVIALPHVSQYRPCYPYWGRGDIGACCVTHQKGTVIFVSIIVLISNGDGFDSSRSDAVQISY